MATYCDDNFGVYDINSEEDIEFYHKVQSESVLKNCVICGRAVKLRPQYDKCNSCCEKIERGMDVDRCDPADYEELFNEDVDTDTDDGDEWEDEEDEDEDEDWYDDDEDDDDIWEDEEDEDDEWEDE